MPLLVTDDLWAVVEPLIPQRPSSTKGGQPRKSDRLCLSGILFVHGGVVKERDGSGGGLEQHTLFDLIMPAV